MVYWSRDGVDAAGAVELKGWDPDVDHAWEQLENGAALIDRLCPDYAISEFVAVLVCPPLDPIAHRRFGGKRISFRGKDNYPDWVRSGSRFASALAR